MLPAELDPAEVEADQLAQATLMRLAEVQVAHEWATRELASMGITTPSPADVSWWLAATPRQRREISEQWVAIVATPEPDWKTLNGDR